MGRALTGEVGDINVSGAQLNVKTLPLSGRSLIEASAGTGKTYTITSLVLRCVLGRGIPRPLEMREILIVTFTRAATEELRGRVRERLHCAQKAFLSGDADGDPYIRELLADTAERERDIGRLRQAELDLDLAAIQTIHGFANSCLQQYAFESGVRFDVQLQEGQDPIETAVIRDVWRELIYPLSSFPASVMLSRFPDSDAFIIHLRAMAQHPNTVLTGVPDKNWHALQLDIQQRLHDLARLWSTRGEELLTALQSCRFNKGGRQGIERASGALQKLHSDGVEPAYHDVLGLSRHHLSAELSRNKQQVLPDHPLIEAIEGLCSVAGALAPRALHDAIPLVAERMEARKKQRNCIGFDDLLQLLDGALKGAGGTRLARVITDQYPLAMIDEFQDTDPVQWSVFRRIYADRGALLLIGDPKQAIYRFRGADIHTYIAARRDTEARFRLGVNYRSVPKLVDAVNALFQRRSDADPFMAPEDIPFDPVTAGQDASAVLTINGDAIPPLQFMIDPTVGSQSKTQLAKVFSSHCVNHLAELLQQARSGQVRIGERRLVESDIAILVRGKDEAAKLTPLLDDAGIAWRYQAGASVYKSAEAQDMFNILIAVLARGQERSLRAAMGTALMCRRLDELEQLFTNEHVLATTQQVFEDLYDRWVRHGVLAMCRALLFAFNVPQRLLCEPRGERRLTDILHLAELLQLESDQLDSVESLLAVLSRRITATEDDAETHQLRLESDAARVQIATMHASKGLEFPVVYIPFPWTAREADFPVWYDHRQQRYWDLTGSVEAMQRADRERLAEDVRLLYVAFTRARQLCVSALAVVKPGGAGNALDWLLDATDGNHPDRWQALAGCSGVALREVSALTQRRLEPVAITKASQAARMFAGNIPKNWGITSYSSLMRLANARAEHVFRQPELQRESVLSGPIRQVTSLLDFDRGASHGSFLHGLLEHADFASVAAGASQRSYIEKAVATAQYDAGWVPVLEQMLTDVLCTPLDGDQLRLATLPAVQRQSELGFDISLGWFDGHRLDALLRANGMLPDAAPTLDFQRVNGLLTGYVDLVFQYQGRYYVADFKSNYLGPRRSDYDTPAMTRSIVEHRYDLQYLLYSLALERHLKQRLGQRYDPDRHYGGVYYLYLRGMSASAEDGYGVFYQRPDDALRASVNDIIGVGQ